MSNIIKKEEILFSNFKLPIEYLKEKDKHTLCPYLLEELELAENVKINEETQPVYNYLFQPTHIFSKQMIQKWKTHFTTNVEYLTETQEIIKNMYLFKTKKQIDTNNVSELLELWKDIKQDDFFLEKYQYMELDFLKEFNRSKDFLLTISLITLLSPLLYILIPIIILLMPFITLKTMGLSISFSSYFVMIKGLFMSYFFKTTINNFTIDKIAYMVITVIMGCFQMYQTFISTYHYYNNIKKINSQIYSLKQYLEITITNIEYLIQINPTGLYYKQFFIETECQCSQLKQLYMDIKDITPFSNSIYKLTDCGILLQKYYKLYENKEYEDALRYSFGFNGYLDNLLGIYDNHENGYINFNNFIEDNKLITDASGEPINSVCKFKEIYYPVLKENNPVKNDINMDKNLTISGPNASGKTSIIKTIAINVIFTQQIGAGFYNSCDLTPYTNIHCYLNINDFSGRDSLFQQEARKCLNIIKSIEECDKSSRHLLIIDELYSGTNPIDSEKASYAFLLYLANKNNLRFCLTTHLSKVCKKLNKNKKIKNIKMDVIKTENYDFKYTYKIKNGISQIYGGYKVLSDMGYPIEILDNMKS